jgi:replicative DNA helicase
MTPETTHTARAAELAVIGAVLAGYAPPEDFTPLAFTDMRCRLVAEVVLQSRAAGTWSPADVVDRCERAGKLEAVSQIFGEAAEHNLGIASLEADWPRVREAKSKRELAERVRGVLALSGELSAEEMAAEIFEAAGATQSPQGDDTRNLLEVVTAAAHQIQAASQGSEPPGVPTGFPDLDALLGRLCEGNVTILAGRPSMGKSALARSIALNAMREGYGVHVFSLEDTASTYGRRVLADLGRVDLHRLASTRKGSITRADMASLTSAFDQVRGATGSCLVDDSSRLSSAQIASRVRRHRPRNKTRLVVVDYVGLIREDVGKGGNIGAVVTKAMHGLVELARKERIAVLALAQLNRMADSTEDGRPRMAQLRDSGELEQCAYGVMLVHRPDFHDPNCKPEWKGKGLVDVAKNKNGPTGDVVMKWDASTATYQPLSLRSVA